MTWRITPSLPAHRCLGDDQDASLRFGVEQILQQGQTFKRSSPIPRHTRDFSTPWVSSASNSLRWNLVPGGCVEHVRQLLHAANCTSCSDRFRLSARSTPATAVWCVPTPGVRGYLPRRSRLSRAFSLRTPARASRKCRPCRYRLRRAIKVRSHGRETLGQLRETIVEFPPDPADSCAFCAILPPPVRDGFQQRDQRVGVATSTFWSAPNSIKPGSCCSAALRNDSPGRNAMTNSGAWSN